MVSLCEASFLGCKNYNCSEAKILPSKLVHHVNYNSKHEIPEAVISAKAGYFDTRRSLFHWLNNWVDWGYDDQNKKTKYHVCA